MLKVAFICVHNSCRSQMAEGWAKALCHQTFKAYSAGTEMYPEVKPLAVAVMEEVDVNMSEQYPKLLEDIPEDIDIVITASSLIADFKCVPAEYASKKSPYFKLHIASAI